MAGENRKRRQGSTSEQKETVLDRLGHDFCSSLEENKSTPHTNFSCVTVTLPSDRKPWKASPPNSREKKDDDNRSKEKSKKRAIKHDETDTPITEATSSNSGLLLLCDTAERQSVATSTPTGQSSDCVRTVAETSPMPDLFGQDDDGDTFLHIAVVQGDQPLTEFFIQRMKSRGIDIYNKLRQTPLHLAVITHQMYIVKKLIEGGADVNLMDRHGQTALHLACQGGDVNCVYAIRDVTQGSRFQIRLDLKNFQGCSALHVATLNGSQQLVETLLDMGADINDQDSNSGRTPLHHAVEAGKYHVAEYLISRGADVNKVTFAGNTPLHTASGREMDQMAKLLMTHGANVNIANLEGDTPKVVRSSEQTKRHFRSKGTDSKRRKK